MLERVHKIKCGNVERMSFNKIKNVLDIPYLIEIQKKSYENFIKHGIGEVFKDFSPINDFSGKLSLEFLDYTIDSESKYDVEECKNRDANYTQSLKAKVRLTIKETGEMVEQTIFMGDIPKMTETGTFIINGAERVVVSQLVRSPGVYTTGALDKNGIMRYDTTLIPNRGAWLEFEQDANNVLFVRIDRQRKITATVLLRALGYGDNATLLNLYDNDDMIAATIEKDGTELDNTEAAKIEVYRKLKPGEVPTQSHIDALLTNTFFDYKRYDLSRVGRFKFNQRLSLAKRIAKQTLAEDIILDGEILAERGEKLSVEKARMLQNMGVNEAYIYTNEKNESGEFKRFKVIGNNTVDLQYYIKSDPKEIGITEKVYYPVLRELLEECGGDTEKLRQACEANVDRLQLKHISVDDIVSAVNYNLCMKYGFFEVDNIDHLSNRRVRSVGELLQNQFRVGISRLERAIRDKMNIAPDPNEITPQTLINIRPVSSAIREFFGSSQLSQFMDQPNPIAELTHKRKLSALGPGGLNRERAGFEVRDVHHSHYGRMCPIETPEGQNIGLITSLSSYAKVNEYGFIEAPYRKVDKEKHIVTEEVHYLPADEEDENIIAQANEPLNPDGSFVNERVICRYKDYIKEYHRDEVDYMDVSPKQLVSVATSLIPFLENDDANRALMGSNMQRQAVPLLAPQAPIIGTGMECVVARDSGVCEMAKEAGEVIYVTADLIKVKEQDGFVREYRLKKFRRSNQGTCINQIPRISKGDYVEKGALLADGPSTENGELALGRNVLVGFMTWEGYNYEDAILISEDLVKDDTFTSIHIEEYELEARSTKLGEEQITRDIPNISADLLKHLDEDGIVMVGAEVNSGDYLVGKVTPKGETELTPEERLLRAIFGEKAREVRDVSLKVPHGERGTVVHVQVFDRKNKDELAPGVNKLVRVYVAQKRKISVGDKIAGRHGNKGVISRILPREDMPFMEDGTPLQIVLNPLGVPSRMNIGQVLEVHLGLVANMLGFKVATPVFDGASENDIKEMFEENHLPPDGKIQLYDGRTGEPFENRVTVGYMYILKLIHLVDDKMHARSVGPYSLVTQQPLGGKAQFGGQRFGEMEVWALYAYGAANILQEILTVKSDDIMGRQKIFDSIIKSNITADPGTPESFKVLKKEMQSLALDMRLMYDGKEESVYSEEDDDERIYDKQRVLGETDDELQLDFDMDSHGFESLFEEDAFGDEEGIDIFDSFKGEESFDLDIDKPDTLFEDDEEDVFAPLQPKAKLESFFETDETELDDENELSDGETLLQSEFDDDDQI
ncbi:MAG: DNA-directed RNA polymerase subunit beta [Christensenellales bacterium]